jgi:hypothetical protein
VVARIWVALLTVTPVAAVPPKNTVAPETKFVPVIVTEVPPDGGPEVGDMLLIFGPVAEVVLIESVFADP